MPESSIGPNLDPARTLASRTGSLDARAVWKIHQNSDVDFSSTSQHHTLGPLSNQASPGGHIHDGTTSKQLLDGVSITGSRGGNAALASVISVLVAMGATDNTTA